MELQEIDKEIKRMASLPHNAVGRIADTYDTLQSLVLIREMQRTYLAGRDGPDAVKTLIFCSDLISYNIIKLLQRILRTLSAGASPQLASVIGPAVWISNLLGLSDAITTVAIAHGGLQLRRRQRVELINELLDTYSDVCVEFTKINMTRLVSDSIERGYLDDAVAALVQNFKLISASIQRHTFTRTSYDFQVDGDYYAYIRICIDSMCTSADTYIDQFRLLHQIPEALAVVIDHGVRESVALASAGNIIESAHALDKVMDLFDLVIVSLDPLLELMYPSEYYKFRENLGGTSGSHSQSLALRLLREAYMLMATTFRHVVENLDSASDRGAVAALTSAAFGFRHRVYLWRQKHLLLPRNVLGVETTSLTGSKNAPDAVHRLAETFERLDPLTSHFRDDGAVFAPPPTKRI